MSGGKAIPTACLERRLDLSAGLEISRCDEERFNQLNSSFTILEAIDERKEDQCIDENGGVGEQRTLSTSICDFQQGRFVILITVLIGSIVAEVLLEV